MPELRPAMREVFEMTTKHVEPELDSWKEQQDRQRHAARTRRLGAFAAVAAILAVLAIIALFVASGPSEDAVGPADGNGAPSASPPLAPGLNRQDRVFVALDGTELGSIDGLPQDAYGLSLSSDGTTIAFVTDVDATDTIATIRTDATELTLLGAGAEPAISPDASRIAFVRDDDIWVMNIDGTGARAVTDSEYRDEFPQWSPDGTTIVYDNLGSSQPAVSGYLDTSVIMTVPAAGGEPTLISRGREASEPAYSPDGTRIVYRGHGSIWIMNADGSGAHEIAHYSEGTSDAPRWSPDGTKIAYTDYRSGWRPDLALASMHGDWPIEIVHIVDLETGENTNLHLAMATFVNAPQWVPTSDGLLLNVVRKN